MEKRVANYKVFITKDQETGSQKTLFVALVPKLGTADDGQTIEEALTNIKSLIKFHLECLIDENQPIPAPDSEETLITSTSITLSPEKLEKYRVLIT